MKIVFTSRRLLSFFALLIGGCATYISPATENTPKTQLVHMVNDKAGIYDKVQINGFDGGDFYLLPGIYQLTGWNYRWSTPGRRWYYAGEHPSYNTVVVRPGWGPTPPQLEWFMEWQRTVELTPKQTGMTVKVSSMPER